MSMIAAYAQDTSRWDAWQHGYRFGAFYIFPPPGVIEAVDALRHRYDPASNAICRAHISISEPLPGALTTDQLAEIREVLASIEPFSIHYGPLRTFLPHSGVCYTIEPVNTVAHVRTLIHATTTFSDVTPKRAQITPHMTIAEFISVERTQELLEALKGNVPEGEFECDRIEYAVPNDDFRFERVLTIPLTGSGGGPD